MLSVWQNWSFRLYSSCSWVISMEFSLHHMGKKFSYSFSTIWGLGGCRGTRASKMVPFEGYLEERKNSWRKWCRKLGLGGEMWNRKVLFLCDLESGLIKKKKKKEVCLVNWWGWWDVCVMSRWPGLVTDCGVGVVCGEGFWGSFPWWRVCVMGRWSLCCYTACLPTLKHPYPPTSTLLTHPHPPSIRCNRQQLYVSSRDFRRCQGLNLCFRPQAKP